VANALAAVRAGATHVQGTINGYGERCGNLNLTSFLPNLVFKYHIPAIPPEKLRGLKELSHFVDERANLTPNRRAPYVGESAFAHKAGVHVSAVLKNPRTYEHIPPGVGGEREALSGLRRLGALQPPGQAPGAGGGPLQGGGQAPFGRGEGPGVRGLRL
jgi:2-isopropylmalate synthase